MGLFRRVGRQVERFKREATEAASRAVDYQCDACDELLDSPYEQCPACGVTGQVSKRSVE